MTAHIARHGAPDILCIWRLGATEQVLLACSAFITSHTPLNVDGLRIPFELSRYIDIFRTGSDAQSAEVHARHPGAPAEVLSNGPGFPASGTFFLTGTARDLDIVYVAAAQPCKWHDILFNALARLSHDLMWLCVFGYGEMVDALLQRAPNRELSVAFLGPPVVSHDAVKLLLNRVRVGLLCGIDDGSPATDRTLTGLTVLANDGLHCGFHYITPKTGRSTPRAGFAEALAEMVLQRRTWPHSERRLAGLIGAERHRRGDASRP